MIINLCGFKGFMFEKGDTSKEMQIVSAICIQEDIKFKFVEVGDTYPNGFIPCGSVEFCEDVLGYHVKPNYFPDEFEHLIGREVWCSDKYPLDRKLEVFIKPADRYKRFDGQILYFDTPYKSPPYIFSDVVHFVNEWRIYMYRGIIFSAEWYAGDEINTPDIPTDYLYKLQYTAFTGAVDVGVTDKDEFLIVEAHHPYACGWYGKKYKFFVQWLIHGWKYMMELKDE